MFDRDLQEIEFEDVSPSAYKMPMNTCNTIRHTNSYFSPRPGNLESFPEALDLSIDCHLYQENASFIEKGVIYYLKTCLVEDINKEDAFLNGRLFSYPSFTQLENEADNDLQVLIYNNHLLSDWTKKTLLQNFKEFHELNCLLAEVKSLLGTALAQEIVYIISSVFDSKLYRFKEILSKTQNDWLIPKFDRFWGDQEMEATFTGELKVFQELSNEDIRAFAAADVQKIASQLYFSDKLKHLNMRNIKVELKPNLNVLDKFSSLVILITKNVFLTIAGMSQSQTDMEEYQGELAVHTSEEGVATGCDLVKRVKQH